MQSLLNCDCFDLIGWHPVCQNSIEIERCTDRLCRIAAIASNHHDAGNAGSPQRLDSPGVSRLSSSANKIAPIVR